MNLVSMPDEVWAFLAGRGCFGAKDVNAAVAAMFDEVSARIARSQVRTSGPPRAHFHICDGAPAGFEVGVPIHPDDAQAARDVGLGTAEAHIAEALLHIHRGPYSQLGEAYHLMELDLAARGLKGRGDVWEVYLSDPDKHRPEDLLTQILWPVEPVSAPGAREPACHEFA